VAFLFLPLEVAPPIEQAYKGTFYPKSLHSKPNNTIEAYIISHKPNPPYLGCMDHIHKSLNFLLWFHRSAISLNLWMTPELVNFLSSVQAAEATTQSQKRWLHDSTSLRNRQVKSSTCCLLLRLSLVRSLLCAINQRKKCILGGTLMSQTE
jgi:hypothetical protein